MTETYKFAGPMPGRKVGRNKGIMRQIRLAKRQEAEARQKEYRRNRDRLLADNGTAVPDSNSDNADSVAV